MLLLAVTAAGIMCIRITWLAFALTLVNIALLIAITVIYMMRQGELAVKKMHANDLEREDMLRTGIPKELDKHKEYKPWKGYAIGAITTVPLLVCLFIHLILGLVAGFGVHEGAGTVANVVHLTFTAPIYVLSGNAIDGALCFALLYCVPISIVSAGISYRLGARKILKQYEKIRKTQESIYGTKR